MNKMNYKVLIRKHVGIVWHNFGDVKILYSKKKCFTILHGSHMICNLDITHPIFEYGDIYYVTIKQCRIICRYNLSTKTIDELYKLPDDVKRVSEFDVFIYRDKVFSVIDNTVYDGTNAVILYNAKDDTHTIERYNYIFHNNDKLLVIAKIKRQKKNHSEPHVILDTSVKFLIYSLPELNNIYKSRTQTVLEERIEKKCMQDLFSTIDKVRELCKEACIIIDDCTMFIHGKIIEFVESSETPPECCICMKRKVYFQKKTFNCISDHNDAICRKCLMKVDTCPICRAVKN